VVETGLTEIVKPDWRFICSFKEAMPVLCGQVAARSETGGSSVGTAEAKGSRTARVLNVVALISAVKGNF